MVTALELPWRPILKVLSFHDATKNGPLNDGVRGWLYRILAIENVTASAQAAANKYLESCCSSRRRRTKLVENLTQAGNVVRGRETVSGDAVR